MDNEMLQETKSAGFPDWFRRGRNKLQRVCGR
jgi:hypothetical protein